MRNDWLSRKLSAFAREAVARERDDKPDGSLFSGQLTLDANRL